MTAPTTTAETGHLLINSVLEDSTTACLLLAETDLESITDPKVLMVLWAQLRELASAEDTITREATHVARNANDLAEAVNAGTWGWTTPQTRQLNEAVTKRQLLINQVNMTLGLIK